MSDFAFTCILPVWAGDKADEFTLALDSVIGGTVAPDAVIICQDGDLPPDLEAACAAGAVRAGARRVRHQGPRGVQHSFNLAMREVETPWVARADADDINLPHRFEVQIRYLRQHPDIAALGGTIVEFWPDGRRRRKPMPLDHDSLVRFARWRMPLNNMTTFFRADAYRACGGYADIRLKEDYALWLKFIGHGYRIANVPDDLVLARLSDNFYERRSGLKNLASEWALWRLRRTLPGLGGPEAALAFLARAGALSFGSAARLVYEGLLRR